MAFAPSGRQFEIRRGELAAVVVEVGGGLRELRVGDRPLIEPYAVDAICDGAHGALLVPWPNRLEDGRYRFDGQDLQLDLSDPALRNAIHGLVRWRAWRRIRHEAARLVMGLTLYPTPGYPFPLALRAAYSLDDEGLVAEISARNVGERACPYAVGQHLYLSPGGGGVDAARLAFAAQTRIVADPVRRLPTGRAPVPGTPFDFRRLRPVGGARLDDAFTDLERGPDGFARVRLQGADGRTVELRLDRGFPYVQLYTGDQLAPGRRRTSLAVEPMSAPANAFRSGEGLLCLAPGERTKARWGLRLV